MVLNNIYIFSFVYNWIEQNARCDVEKFSVAQSAFERKGR